jgi:hypothetical protein
MVPRFQAVWTRLSREKLRIPADRIWQAIDRQADERDKLLAEIEKGF